MICDHRYDQVIVMLSKFGCKRWLFLKANFRHAFKRYCYFFYKSKFNCLRVCYLARARAMACVVLAQIELFFMIMHLYHIGILYQYMIAMKPSDHRSDHRSIRPSQLLIHDSIRVIRPSELPIHDSIRPSKLPIHDNIRPS